MQKTKKRASEQKAKTPKKKKKSQRTTKTVERICEHEDCSMPFNTRVKVGDENSGRKLCQSHYNSKKGKEATAKRRAERMNRHCPKCDKKVVAIFVKSTPTPSDARPPQRIHCPHCFTYIETGNARGVYVKQQELMSFR